MALLVLLASALMFVCIGMVRLNASPHPRHPLFFYTWTWVLVAWAVLMPARVFWRTRGGQGKG